MVEETNDIAFGRDRHEGRGRKWCVFRMASAAYGTRGFRQDGNVYVKPKSLCVADASWCVIDPATHR